VNSIENRLLRDLRAQAGHITPSSVHPLRLPEPGGHHARPLRHLRPRHRPAWMAPLAAAAAVTAVLFGAFAATQAIRHPAPRNQAPANWPDELPPYYVYLPQAWRSSAVVAKTPVGEVIATLHAPRPFTFEDDTSGDCSQSISSAGDREFVLMAAGQPPRVPPRTRPGAYLGDGTPVRLFLLQVAPAGEARLTAVRLPERLGTNQDVCYALSPDGGHLALTFTPNPSPGHAGTMVLQVITLATGQVRQWTYTNTLRGDPVRDLSWVTPRTLAFYVPLNAPDAPTTTAPPPQDSPGTYLLDTAAPSHNLLADSRHLTGELFEVQAATPDGTLLIGNHYQEPSGRAVLDEVSARTGQVIRTFGKCIDACLEGPEAVLWSDPSGDRLVVAESATNPPPGPQTDLIGTLKPGGLKRGGAFTPLRPQPRVEGDIPGLAW
jgi:hypothetical protein